MNSKLTKDQIIKKIFLKYGYSDREADISINYFICYIENGLKVIYKDWVDSNDLKTIEKYISYYQTH